MSDFTIVGSGLYGCTAARMLAEAGYDVAVYEKRGYIGGNCASRMDPDTGIELHMHGPHIFHTGNEAVWRFINRFASFNGYQHHVLSMHSGKIYQMPIGLHLLCKFAGHEMSPEEARLFMSVNSNKERVFDAFISGYTMKQWGLSIDDIDKSIIDRIPVRYNYDTNYYSDMLQGIPQKGYQSMFESLLDHPSISLCLGKEWTIDMHDGRSKVLYSGPIDSLFNYRYGCLPWRSLGFEWEFKNVSDYQGAAQINYPDMDVEFNRIHEFKHYHPEWKDVMRLNKTIICREYPKAWSLGDEPYYPVDNSDSRKLFLKYVDLASSFPWLKIGGRLGSFRYMDMDDVIAQAIEHVKEFADE